MKLSTKTRYGLAVCYTLIHHECHGASSTKLAESLSLSKLYLEQILSQLKRFGLVESEKGPKGCYKIISPDTLSVYDVFEACETEWIEDFKEDKLNPELNERFNAAIYKPLQKSINESLKAIKLIDLKDEAFTYMI